MKVLFLFITKSAFTLSVIQEFMTLVYPEVQMITARNVIDASNKTQHVRSYRIITVVEEGCTEPLNKYRVRKVLHLRNNHVILDLNEIVMRETGKRPSFY